MICFNLGEFDFGVFMFVLDVMKVLLDMLDYFYMLVFGLFELCEVIVNFYYKKYGLYVLLFCIVVIVGVLVVFFFVSVVFVEFGDNVILGDFFYFCNWCFFNVFGVDVILVLIWS